MLRLMSARIVCIYVGLCTHVSMKHVHFEHDHHVKGHMQTPFSILPESRVKRQAESL